MVAAGVGGGVVVVAVATVATVAVVVVGGVGSIELARAAMKVGKRGIITPVTNASAEVAADVVSEGFPSSRKLHGSLNFSPFNITFSLT